MNLTSLPGFLYGYFLCDSYATIVYSHVTFFTVDYDIIFLNKIHALYGIYFQVFYYVVEISYLWIFFRELEYILGCS